MREPIDPFTQRRVSEVLKKAQREGLDPAEALHAAGLILTPLRDKQIRLQAMNYMVLQIEAWRPAEFLRRKPHTPADIYEEILAFMREHLASWEKNQ